MRYGRILLAVEFGLAARPMAARRNSLSSLSLAEAFLLCLALHCQGGVAGVSLDPKWPENPRVLDVEGAAHCVQQTLEGGYVIGGYVIADSVLGCPFVMKLDTLGNMDSEWDNNPVDLAGICWPHWPYAPPHVVQDRRDGGYVVATGVETGLGVFRLDSRGSVDGAWNPNPRVFDGGNVASLQQTTDGGFVVVGTTAYRENSPYKVYVLKLDGQGNLDPSWSTNPKTYGGGAESAQETQDGGYIIAGCTEYGGSLIKLDSQGNLDPLWGENPKIIGIRWPCTVEQTQDGGYVVGGDSGMPAVVKLTPEGSLDSLWNTNPMTLGPLGAKPVGIMKWIHQTSNGSYMAACLTADCMDYTDAFLVGIDTRGSLDPDWQPNPICLGLDHTWVDAGQATRDGGGIVVGGLWATEPTRVWVAKLAPVSTLVVDVNGSGQYSTIQPAIDAASDGDIVLVKPGEYVITEPINFNRLYNADDPASPPVKNIVVRSEGGAEVTTIRLSGAPLDPQVNVVIFENGEGAESRLDGITLTGGTASGVRFQRASPTLINCTISGNSRTGWGPGGGILCVDGSCPTIENCLISANEAADGGGGIYCGPESHPIIVGCKIAQNTVTGNDGGCWAQGGGILCYGSSPVITNCTITENLAWGSGGGIRCLPGASPTLTDCTIWGNTAWCGGGGVYCSESSPTIKGCTIAGNRAIRWLDYNECFGSGGGMESIRSSPTLTDCTISTNWADYYGGGVYCEESLPTLTNCTISGNAASSEGGGVYCRSSSVSLTNCIVWGNTGKALQGETTIVTYSCIESGDTWPGLGNINRDPLFCGWPSNENWVDASQPGPGSGTSANPYSNLGSALGGFNLSLQQGSPCIGSGEGGKDMGAGTGMCSAVGAPHCTLHLGPGRYSIQGLTLTNHVSIEGAGYQSTTIEGTTYGLRSDAFMSGVTISRGDWGGLVVASGEAPEIRDCAIIGNGGGLVCYGSPAVTNCLVVANGVAVSCSGGSPTLVNCTISENSCSPCGGVCCSESSPTLTNCIIWGYSPESICGNLSHCLTDQDPLFVDPVHWDDNGTPNDTADDKWVFDCRLQPGSPCIDAGTPEGAPATDIEGHARPCRKGVDIGAYEYCYDEPPLSRFRRGNVNADERIDVADAIFLLSHLFARGPAPSCRDAADANDDGSIDIADAISILNHLFAHAGPLPAPFGECGVDPTTGDALDCASFRPCE